MSSSVTIVVLFLNLALIALFFLGVHIDIALKQISAYVPINMSMRSLDES